MRWNISVLPNVAVTISANRGQASERYNNVWGNIALDGNSLTWSVDEIDGHSSFGGNLIGTGTFIRSGSGLLDVTGRHDRVVGAYRQDAGYTRFLDAGTLTTPSFSIPGNANSGLVVSNTAVAFSSAANHFRLGTDHSSAYGALYLTVGAALTNGFTINGKGGTADVHVGGQGLGYVFQTDGGFYNASNNVNIGGSGYGKWYLRKGLLWARSSNWKQVIFGAGTSGDVSGVLTLDGPEARVEAFSVRIVGDQNSKCFAVMNLRNGGRVKTTNFLRHPDTATNMLYYINFDGGVMCGGSDLFKASAAGYAAPSRLTVYGGGAVIEVGAGYSNWDVPLRAATGKGIESILLPTSSDFVVTNKNAYGPLKLEITTTGTGAGATAICDFDPMTRKQKGGIVTNPGWDYEEGKVSCTVWSPDRTQSFACLVTLADNVTTGGVTKIGPGTLNLCCANSYGGPTVIREGSLNVKHDAALPATTTLIADANTNVDLNRDTTIAGVGGCGQIAKGTVTVTDELVFDVADLYAGKSLLVTHKLICATGSKVRLTNTHLLDINEARRVLVRADCGIEGNPTLELDSNMTGGWRVVRSSSTELALTYTKGTLLLFR